MHNIKYSEYIQSYFTKIETELLDLVHLIKKTPINTPKSKSLIYFCNECLVEYNRLMKIDLTDLDIEGNPDIDYMCAELSTDTYALLNKLQNNKLS